MRICKTGKVCHRTQTAAFITMKRLNNKALNHYKCPHCKWYHLGTSNRDDKIQARIDQLLGKQ